MKPTKGLGAYAMVRLCCCCSSPPLILIGLDGFGADLIMRNVTPVVQRLRQCGVHTPYMRPVYPTLTFPNMYTIATVSLDLFFDTVLSGCYSHHWKLQDSLSETFLILGFTFSLGWPLNFFCVPVIPFYFCINILSLKNIDHPTNKMCKVMMCKKYF